MFVCWTWLSHELFVLLLYHAKNVVRYPRWRDIRTTLFKNPILRDALVIILEIMTTLNTSLGIHAGATSRVPSSVPPFCETHWWFYKRS